VNPALQEQAISAELAADEYELSGHPTHALDTVAPAVKEYVPAMQAVQTGPLGQLVSVRSSPFIMTEAIALVACMLSHSSTKNKPDISPFQWYPKLRLPTQFKAKVRSVTGLALFADAERTPFT
jgi:hypothetical protein